MKNNLFSTTQSYTFLSTLLLIAACVLRFHDLSGASIWLDEAIAAINSQGTLAQTISNTQHRNSSPALYPVLLYLVQKIDVSATAVRLPSAIGSALAILVILSLPRVGIGKRTAFLAAALMTFSASQIEFAQEVREYSISVLFASIMLYTLVLHLRHEQKKIAFYTTMLLAPLVQYGLVLFAAAILLTLALVQLHRRNWKAAISRVFIPGILLGAGGVFSLWLTLRFQWSASTSAFYLEAGYYTGKFGDVQGILHFLAQNTRDFLQYIVPGSWVVGLAIPALGLFAYRCIKGTACHNLIPQLALIAVTMVGITSVAHIYPYGSIRQDLFLAPVVSLAFSTAYVSVSDGLPRGEQIIWAGMVFLLILASGILDIRDSMPYREKENIKRVMSELSYQSSPADQVYIFHGARKALKFYNIDGQNFVYGDKHHDQPDEYIKEYDVLVKPQTKRVWLVFSHANFGIKQHIIDKLATRWEIENKVNATGASLYLAVRRQAGLPSIDEVE